jgi:hypothetical protein
MRIVVAGALAAAPRQGGAAWAVLQYVLGFQDLGHDVLLLEPAPADAEVCAYFTTVTERFGLSGAAALLHPDGTASGLPAEAVRRWVVGSDLLVNLAGVLTDETVLAAVHRRVYVDLDPAFTQLWQAVDGVDMHLAGHDRHVTVGLEVGRDGCTVPTCGVAWWPTLPPVVLDRWPMAETPPTRGLTTVANWRSYGSIHHASVHYGQKVHSVRELIDLPRLVPHVRVEPAIGIDAAEETDLVALRTHGWLVADPIRVAGSPDAYRAFVGSSLGELGIAKAGYVRSACGWFSDRSACYLASGRPVIAQDTGWSAHLPVGEGLLAFSDAADAAAAANDVLGGYDRHRKAARAIAEEVLDARRVLPRLLEIAGGS